MNEKRAREILEKWVDIRKDNGLYSNGWYLSWSIGRKDATLDGVFTVEELEAIVWWMKNKGGEGG